MQISLAGVGKRLGSVQALIDVSCEIPPGSIVAVLGANGAGKSTLLKLLASMWIPTSGEIQLDGEGLHRQRVDLRKRIAYLPDSPYMLGRTPLDHIAAMLDIYEVDSPGIEERVAAVLGELDLLPLAECSLRTLSRGQQFKAALAALLALDPELWLLDEPFAAGMDPQGIAVLKRYANKAAARGSTILYTTQIVEIAEQFSDRVLVFHRGTLHAYESLTNLAQRAPGERVLERILDELRLGVGESSAREDQPSEEDFARR
jgi:ABC-type multidrug transport system ATPase subunit